MARPNLIQRVIRALERRMHEAQANFDIEKMQYYSDGKVQFISALSHEPYEQWNISPERFFRGCPDNLRNAMACGLVTDQNREAFLAVAEMSKNPLTLEQKRAQVRKGQPASNGGE